MTDILTEIVARRRIDIEAKTTPLSELKAKHRERTDFRPFCKSLQKNMIRPGMAAIIADKDKVLQINTLGYADVETQRPMKSDTVFWIASQTKPITAAAVMILVDEGKLSLTEPITKYLPELANLKVAVKDGDKTTLVSLLFTWRVQRLSSPPPQSPCGYNSEFPPR